MVVEQPVFEKAIQGAYPSGAEIRNRRWVYVPYDRFTDRVGPLTEQAAADTGIAIVESVAKALRRPYHKRKLALLISNMRHFALEQARRGVAVLYQFSDRSHGQALVDLQRESGLAKFTVMEPAERELRLDLEAAVAAGLQLEVVPDRTWLSTTEDFVGVYGAFRPGKHYVMDRFYRHMRQISAVLMQNAKPVGGKFSFDAENRNAYKGEVPVPRAPGFAPDAITMEVLQFVEARYGHHFGAPLLDSDGATCFDLPTSQAECDEHWRFFVQHLLPHFGRYEDAMRDDHGQLFHSKTSALLNLGRLLPGDLVRDVGEAAERGNAPLASCEGFIRQVLGWREFMRHIHRQTDGFRLLRGHVPDEPRKVAQEGSPDADGAAQVAYTSGGGQTGWILVEELAGATPSALGAALPLPAVYWGVHSGLHCVDTAVAQVVSEGWSHHITRLMVLSNLANLCGFSPRELTDWFWFAYIDAYDWVVEPNVLGMATFADGGVTATKPYVSGAAYINRMSNYCGHCEYDPKRSTGAGSCPFTALYWTFMERNRDLLSGNARLQMPYRTLDRKTAQEMTALRARAQEAITHLLCFARPEYGIVLSGRERQSQLALADETVGSRGADRSR